MKGAAIARGLAPGGRRSLAPGGLVLPSASDVVTFGTGGDYADIGALIDAGLADTYARNTDTGRLYLTRSDGFPVGADAAASGTLTLRSEIVGTEPNAAACLNISAFANVSFTGSECRLASTSSLDAYLRPTSSVTGASRYMAGYGKIVTIDTDANRGYLTCAVFAGDGTTRDTVVLSSELGKAYGLTSIALIDATSNVGGGGLGSEYTWWEVWRTSDGVRAYVGHTLQAAYRLSLSNALAWQIGIDGGGSPTTTFDLKNFRSWTIA